jgi:outer membrane protein OmpA-like peptidoglycan-associated protein/tetratricopeptide (TPR) repeat protein
MNSTVKRMFVSIIVTSFCLPGMAQTTKADRLFQNWDYFRAAKLYKKEAEKNPGPDVYFKLGECYRIMKQYKNKELAAFDKVNAAGVYSKTEFYLNYGLVLRKNGRYRQSKVAFNKFRELVPDDPRGRFFSDAIDIVLNDQKWDEPITIINVAELNTADADFCPVLYKDGLIFVSSRKTSIHKKIYGWTGANYLDLYYAQKGNSDLNFASVNPFSQKNGEYNDGPASFSSNYDTIYITRVEEKFRRNQKKNFWIEQNKIFISTKKDGQWLKSEPFAYNSDSFSVAIPYLSPDGSRLYFAADMPGGYGETDLYYCNLEGDKWGEPINMGPNINTFNREKYPYIDRSGNFYFSSDGYQGFGGLDICVALNKNGSLQKAKPMKYPFNSYSDDFGIIFIEDGKTGYFSSNREAGGFGDDDIFYFDLTSDYLQKDLETSVYTIGYRPKPHDLDIQFLVNAPKNIPVERRVREIFPLRNYVFFNLGSADIPDRYVLLTPDQVKGFKEDQLDAFAPEYIFGRSKRQMTAYYNVLNIVGDRLGKNPTADITLVGSSEKGPKDGEAMAESVKKYLTEIFQIDEKRINIEGRNKPKIPSEQLGGMLELELLREGDRRVSIESRSPVMLMEYQAGPETLLKPIEISDIQKAPLESLVSFNAMGSDDVFSSWSMEIMDMHGTSLFLGPYTREKVSIPGKVILGNKTEGDFTVTMTGKVFNGNTVIKDTTIHIRLWKQALSDEVIRFSVIYEFNNSKLIPIYKKYLTEVVTPKIPKNGTLIIHGYTDVIGVEKNNLNLSLARATDVGNIFKRALSNAKRTDVKMEIYGFGEDQYLSPFENNLPEERFHNRTVIIDIIPDIE